MDAVFTQLIANEKVWSSLLGGLAGRIGATSVARGIKGALEERFPWLGKEDDEQASGADTVEELADLHRCLTEERSGERG